MESQGIDFKGVILVERVLTLPTFDVANDIGRILLVTTGLNANKLFYGTTTQFEEVGSGSGGGGGQTSFYGPFMFAGAGDDTYDGAYNDTGATENGQSVYTNSEGRVLFYDATKWVLSDTQGGLPVYFGGPTIPLDVSEAWAVGSGASPAPDAVAGEGGGPAVVLVSDTLATNGVPGWFFWKQDEGKMFSWDDEAQAWIDISSGAGGGGGVWVTDGAGGYKIDTTSITDAMVIDDSGVVTLADDSVLSLSSSGTGVTKLGSFSANSVEIAHLQTNDTDLAFKLRSSVGAYGFKVTDNSNNSLFRVGGDGAIFGTISVPTDITTGVSGGMAIDSAGHIHSGTGSTNARTHNYFYNPNGLIGSLQTQDDTFAIQLGGGAGGQVRMDIRNLAGQSIIRFNDSGVITGIQAVPSDITTGAVDGKCLLSSGIMCGSKSGTGTNDHDRWYNPNGLLATVRTNGVVWSLTGGQASSFLELQDSGGNSQVSVRQNYLALGKGGSAVGGARITMRSSAQEVVTIYRDDTTSTNTIFAAHSDYTGTGNEQFRVEGDGDAKNRNNSYGALSDISLKQDIEDSSSQLDDVLQMAAIIKKFRLKADAEAGLDNRQIGWIAQELQAVAPGLIKESPVVAMEDYEEEYTDTDAEGNEVQKTRTLQREVETGETLLGVKYSVAYMKLFKAFGEYVAQTEARLQALEA